MNSWKHAGRVGVLTLLLFGAGNALAQSDGLQVTLGLKLWANTWESPFLNDDPTSGTNLIASANDSLKVAPIPSLSVRYGNVVFSAGYFAKTDYDFSTFSDMVNLGCCGPTAVTQVSSAEREEWDFNLGYFVTPQIAVTVGYKKIDQTYTSTFSAPGVIFASPTTSTTKNTATTIGLLAFAPLGESFALYGNFAYGPAKSKFEGGESLSGTYRSTELGIAHPLGGATVSLGYKIQILDVETKGALPQRARDSTNGVILGVSYTF